MEDKKRKYTDGKREKLRCEKGEKGEPTRQAGAGLGTNDKAGKKEV